MLHMLHTELIDTDRLIDTELIDTDRLVDIFTGNSIVGWTMFTNDLSITTTHNVRT